MSLTFEKLWPLVLLGVIPFLWWARRNTAVDLSPKHLWLSTVIRSTLVATIALALMQPIMLRTAKYVSTVYLLDVSQSVSPAAVQDAIRWIQQTHNAGDSAHSRFIAFAANSMVFEKLEDLTKVPVSAKPRPGSIDQSKTKLAAAMDHAIRSFAPDHLKRLVLISDGNANSGDLEAALQHLRTENVHVFTRSMRTRTTRDAWIEAVMSPSTVTAEEQFPVEVHVYSHFETTADIEIKNGDTVLAKRSVPLKAGLNRIAFEASVKDESGTVVLEASAKVAGDSLPTNNVFRQSTAVLGKPHILYVEGYAPSAKYLKDALTVEGFQVEVKTAAELPVKVEELDAYDALILSDVERRSLSEAQMRTIAAYVRDLGGGFILAGGENTYGKDGYTKSTIEEVLPVTFETEKERQNLSMVVVLDRSGSMAGAKMELAKEATKAPLAQLKEDDRFGVLTFDYNFHWALDLTEISQKKDLMRETIGRIVATGNTNIFPALREAYEKLKATPGETKHIILLSDGQTPADDFRGLAAQMMKDKITVSTVAVTAASDRVLMENIATWGGGRAYYVDNPASVPQIFSEETELAAGKSIQEGDSFRPTVKKTVEAFKGIDFKTAPELQGYVATKAKPTSETLLTTPGDRPLLARWQYALGKSAVFTSDVKDRWAVDWLKWKSYSKFWAQLVRETMRRQDNDEFDFQVVRDGDEALVSINAIEKDGRFRNTLQPQLRMLGPAQNTSTIDVPQVGPGAYETRVPLNQDGAYVFRTADESGGGSSRTLAYSYPDEFHFYPPDLERLRAISAQTGGKFDPQAAEIFDSNGESVSFHAQLWPWLAALALVLYVGDVLLRRLRLFES